jgi:alanine racemase
VSALVVGTKSIDSGESVSYGYTWTATARTNLALVGIGYADGLDRIASNVGSLMLGGVPRRIVGRVAMNALVLDLGQHSAAIGDEVVVFGDPAAGEPAVWDWAKSLGRPCAEIVSVFGSHLPRVY